VKDILKIDENRILKQSNRLIEARYNLTKYEQRFIIAICSQIKANDENFNRVRIKVSDMAHFCKFEPQKAYTLVRSTIMKLLRRTLEIKYPDGNWYVTHWLQSAKYIASESVIEYKIDDELKPELLQLKSAYLSTSAEPLMEFSRDYSVRMYFILKKMLKIRDFEKDLDFFRDRFQLGKTYDKLSNLKDKVIEPALVEINEKSDIRVWHEYVKEGRTYTKIHFIVVLKNDAQKLPLPAKKAKELPKLTASTTENSLNASEKSPGEKWLNSMGMYSPSETAKIKKENINTSELTSATIKKKKWSDEQQADYDLLLKYGVWAERAKKIVVTYDHAQIERNIKYCIKSNNKGNIRDLGAVITNAIINDTYKVETEEKQKALEREQERIISKAKRELRVQEENKINRKIKSEKNDKLAEIRSKKSKIELINVFEKVLSDYNNNDKKLTDEMQAELEKNGIPLMDFISYKSEIARNFIKYLQ